MRLAINTLWWVWLLLNRICYDKRHKAAIIVCQKSATPYSRLGVAGVTIFVTGGCVISAAISDARATGSGRYDAAGLDDRWEMAYARQVPVPPARGLGPTAMATGRGPSGRAQVVAFTGNGTFAGWVSAEDIR